MFLPGFGRCSLTKMSSCVVDSLSLALGQISFAVSDLTKKNYKPTLKEIHEVSCKKKESVRLLFAYIPSLLISIEFNLCSIVDGKGATFVLCIRCTKEKV